MNQQMTVETIMTKSAPAPAGHYSQATRTHGFVFVSGQLPVNIEGVAQAEASFEDQTRLVIENMKAILAATGSDTDHLVRVTAYIVGVENWPKFNALYATLLPQIRPARTVAPVAELHHGCLVEIDAIALDCRAA